MPQAQGLPVGRKKGKKYTHPRTTRPKDIPNTPSITVTADYNPANGNANIATTGFYVERIITDVKIEKIVTKYIFLEYKDLYTRIFVILYWVLLYPIIRLSKRLPTLTEELIKAA